MNSASPSSGPLDPELCLAAESVLHEGETLADFTANTLHQGVVARQTLKALLAKATRGRAEAAQKGAYYTVSEVFTELDDMLQRAQG